MKHPLRSAFIWIFSPEVSSFRHIKKTLSILIHNFYFFLTVIEFLKVPLMKMVAILLMSAKFAT